MNIGYEELMTKVEWRGIFYICDVFAVSTTVNYSIDLTYSEPANQPML